MPVVVQRDGSSVCVYVCRDSLEVLGMNVGMPGKQSLPALNITKKEEAENEAVKNDETSGTDDSGKGSQKSQSSKE